MWGWWNGTASGADAEVTTGRRDVLATAYVRKGVGTLIAVASWAVQTANVSLAVEWRTLGLEEANSEAFLPLIPSYNRASRTERVDLDRVTVPALQGLLIWIKPS